MKRSANYQARRCAVLAVTLALPSACGSRSSEQEQSRALAPNDTTDDDTATDDDAIPPAADDITPTQDDDATDTAPEPTEDTAPEPTEEPAPEPTEEPAPVEPTMAKAGNPQSPMPESGGTGGEPASNAGGGTSANGGEGEQGGAMASGGMMAGTAGSGPDEPAPMLGCVDCEAGYQCFEQLDPGRCFELCATDTPNVTLQTQDDVDNLAALQCEVITGDLTITGPDIESLAGLEHIHVIERSLLVQDTELLEDLSGLEGMLLLVEGLSVDNNAATRSLSALKDTLADEAAIHMNANLVLESLDGLQGFTNPSSIQFTDNHALTDISALSPESTDSLFFSGNQAFTSARFDKLHTIGQGLVFLGEFACQTLDLPLLDYVGGGILIGGNTSLRAIDLASLTRADSMTIASNDALETLGGLPALTSISTSMAIAQNPSLPQCEVDEIGARFDICSCEDNDLEGTCN